MWAGAIQPPLTASSARGPCLARAPQLQEVVEGVAAAAKSLQSCSTLCDPIDGSPPGSPVPGIFQARTLEWVAISFSNAWKWKVKVKSLSRVRLFETPWTAAHQAPLSMGFPGKSSGVGCHCLLQLRVLEGCKPSVTFRSLWDPWLMGWRNGPWPTMGTSSADSTRLAWAASHLQPHRVDRGGRDRETERQKEAWPRSCRGFLALHLSWGEKHFEMLDRDLRFQHTNYSTKHWSES